MQLPGSSEENETLLFALFGELSEGSGLVVHIPEAMYDAARAWCPGGPVEVPSLHCCLRNLFIGVHRGKLQRWIQRWLLLQCMVNLR